MIYKERLDGCSGVFAQTKNRFAKSTLQAIDSASKFGARGADALANIAVETFSICHKVNTFTGADALANIAVETYYK